VEPTAEKLALKKAQTSATYAEKISSIASKGKSQEERRYKEIEQQR
jgi:hypothetical protein